AEVDRQPADDPARARRRRANGLLLERWFGARQALEEFFALARLRRGLEDPPRPAPEVVDVDAALLRLLGNALGKIQRLVENLRPPRSVLAHLMQDRPLGARRNSRLRAPFAADMDAPARSR